MASSSMELKVMYCKDLKAFNFFQKLLVYVHVSIVSDDPDKKLKLKQEQRTPTDKEGEDGNPEWNHEMSFDLTEVSFQDCDHLFVHFDLRHEGLYFGDKTIGEVRVPMKDLIQEANEVVRFLSYQIRTTDGKPNGVLNFSCKVKHIGTNSPTSEITGYPIVNHDHHQPPGIQNPTPEVQSSSLEVHYPSLDLQGNNYSQETYHLPQVHYPLHCPPPEAYYTPPPPPPPPPMVHGSCYYPPQSPEPWAHTWAHGGYNYSSHGNWNPNARQLPMFGDGEKWPNDFGMGRGRHHSSIWTGKKIGVARIEFGDM